METFKFKTSNKNTIDNGKYAILEYYNDEIFFEYNKKFNTNLKIQISTALNPGLLENCESYKIDIIDKNNDDNNIASVKYTGQNNCCGAASTHGMNIYYKFRSLGLSTILHCFEEDLLKNNRKTSLICTDIITTNSNNKIDNLNNFKPITVSNKSLYKNGYKLINTFFNKKSGNMVGYFVKTIDYDINYEREVEIKVDINKDTKIKLENITIGCDPEGFFYDPTNEKYVPSFYIMKGTKNQPIPITKKGHSIQCDNVMFEYNVPPSNNEDDFVKHNLFVQEYLQNKIAKPNGLEIKMIASTLFNEEDLKSEQALEFGCEPDFNAYNSLPNQIPNSANKCLRSAGKIDCHLN